ncbi:hypothetical protein WS62_29800 [Burkholderia sp. ABCPW 14]|uniref:IpaC/SipC family type III secretion system effector n=1 Tax=Burkholderia sp. ABCPW 14 TaxID=1637860 RepID=UPI000770D16D|nr:IpaC/SipC family type III secretion system effector [Burkholderia sp. ABCPW 14]KVD78021.1 hypothetical protein WS62_29800 [Burkholderia sp. ABCPW 14]
MTAVISNQSRVTDLALLRETAAKQGDVLDKAQQSGAAKAVAQADAGLVELIGGATVAGAATQAEVSSVDLASPRLSADKPQVQQEVVAGLKREQENQDRLGQDPSVAIAVGTLLQQFTVTPKGAEAKQEGRQADRANDIASTGTDGANKQVASLFGNSAAEQAFSVILQVTTALQGARQSELQMQSSMTMVQHNAAVAGADAIKAQGQAMLTGAISGGVLQGSLATMGAVQQYRGLNTRASSVENELKPKAELQRFDREQSFELRGKSKPTLGDDEVTQLDAKREGGVSVSHTIEHSGDSLSEEHSQVLSQERPARQHRIEMHDINHQSNEIVAERQRTTGSLLDTSAAIAKNQAEGISGMQQSNARAEQTLAQNTEQVAGTAASAHQDRAQQMRELTQKLHDAAMQVNNAQAGVAGQVASSLKI